MTQESKKYPHGLFTQAEVDYAQRLVDNGDCKNLADAAERVKSERVAPAAFQSGPGDGDWAGIDHAEGDGRVAAPSFPKPEGDESVGDEPSIGNTEAAEVAEVLNADQDALTADAFIDGDGADLEAMAEYDAERVEEATEEVEKKGRRK